MPRVLAPDDAERAVLLAAPRGYCAGVDRAVVTVEKALDLYGAPVYVRKQIVHNKHVVADLESRGAIFVEELDEVPAGETVVFSAHGVSPAVHEQAEERGLKTIDATCPLVTKVHHEARRFAADDYDILLIGHAGHEEVEGTAGEAPEHIQLVESPADVARHRGPRPGAGSPGCRRPRCRSTRPWRPSPRSASGSRCCSTRRATTSATPPRTASSRSRRSPRRRPGDRGRLGELLQLGPVGRGRPRGRRQGVVPRRRRVRDRRGLARRRPHRVGHLRRERARVARRRGARLPRRARLSRRSGGAQRRGVADLRAAQGAAPRPQGRAARPDLPHACGRSSRG